MKITQILTRHLNNVKVFKTEGTFDFYKKAIPPLLRELNSLNILDDTDITTDSLTDLVMQMQSKNLSNNTINKRITHLKTAFKYCKILNADLMSFPKLKQEDKRFNALTKNEVLKLLTYIETSKIRFEFKVILHMFLNTGVRINELCHIETKNVKLDANCVLLTKTKNGRERYVFFTESFKNAYLSPYLATLKNTNQKYLFKATYDQIEELLKRIKKKLGFEKFSPHVLRHTFATTLVHNNANFDLIANLLGHLDITIAKRYLHQDLENTKQLFNEFFKLGNNGENVANA